MEENNKMFWTGYTRQQMLEFELQRRKFVGDRLKFEERNNNHTFLNTNKCVLENPRRNFVDQYIIYDQ